VRAEIQLPADYPHVVMAPGSETLAAPDGSGKAKIVATDDHGKLALTYAFDISPAIIPPSDYADLQKVGSTLGRKSERVFLLEK
jgi:hypothetical protein